MESRNNEDKITLIKDLYELKGFIESIPNKKFDSYLAKSANEFYLRVSSLIKDQKLIEDITEAQSKEAIMLCLNTSIHGKSKADIKEELKQRPKIGDTISQKIGLNTFKEFKQTAVIIPLSKAQIIEQLRGIYKWVK